LGAGRFIAYFFVGMGFCTIFGAAMTYFGLVGTAAEEIASRVVGNYLAAGFAMLIIGSFLALFTPTEQSGVSHREVGGTVVRYCRFCGAQLPVAYSQSFCPSCGRSQV